MIVLGIVISGGLLYLSLRGIDPSRIGAVLGEVRALPLLGAACLPLVTFSFMALRSGVLLRPLVRLPFPTLAKSVLIGFWGNNVLPLRAGEVMRIDYLARQGRVPHSACTAAVAFERILDMFVMLVLFATIIPTLGGIEPGLRAWLIGAIVTTGFVGALVVGRWPGLLARIVEGWLGFLPAALHARLAQLARTFGDGLESLGSLSSFLQTMACTAGYWAFSGVFYWLLFAAFGFELSWWGPVVLLTFTAAGMALPSAPAGIGTYHVFSVWGLTLLGVPKLEAASFGLVAHAVSVVPFTLIAWPIVIRAVARRISRGPEAPGGPQVAGAAESPHPTDRFGRARERARP
jgi:uncharacterized protein (TIRG00374 family)